MDENGIITGKIPNSGSGVHKTYEESIIRIFRNCDLRGYKNEYFVNGEGAVRWGRDKEDYNYYLNNPEYTKVEILSVECTPNKDFVVEFIDSKALRLHLIAEAVERRNKVNTSEKIDTNTLPAVGTGIHKTYPESTFLVFNDVEFSELCRLSYLGIYFSKKLGKVVFPRNSYEYESSGYRDIENRRIYLSEINEHLDDYIELSILNVMPNGERYVVEVIDKNILESYLSEYQSKLKL